MEPVEYLRPLQRRWYVVAAAVLVGVAAAWFSAPTGPTDFVATHTLILETNSDADARAGDQVGAVDTLAFLTTTGEVPQRVAAALGGDPDDLASQVDAVADAQLDTLAISASDSDPGRATALANTFARELVASLEEQDDAERQQEIVDLTTERDDLEQRVAELDATIAAGGGEDAPGTDALVAQRDALTNQFGFAVEQLQQLVDQGPAASGLTTVEEAAAAPIASTSRSVRLLIGGGVGLLLGIGLALWLARIDPRVNTKDEAERAFDLPVLAEVPKRRTANRYELVVGADPESLAAEAYRGLRTALLRAPGPRKGKNSRQRPNGTRVILVVSPGIAEGKTATVANLAAAFAEAGKYVLVISGDLRRPDIHRYLNVAEAPGLSDVLADDESSPRFTDVIRASAIRDVRVVTSGTWLDNPSEALGRVQSLVTSARDFADVVIVDTAPLLATDDASALIPAADLVVVCCRAGRTTAEAARRTTELLDRFNAPVAGVALIGAPKIPTARHYYYSYYWPRHHHDHGATQHEDRPPLVGEEPSRESQNGDGSIPEHSDDPDELGQRRRQV